MLKFCRTCMFFVDKQGPGVVGTCRRFPPKAIPAVDRVLTRYPEVSPDMRACGEHQHNKRLIRVDKACRGGSDAE